ncbi:sarcoplasmic reticulum histidine-rich calcium-binding protein-like [Battus philenor]|uniref:sarcoplasmic reticulum histidine-rich calcium-binding protein-like n=1 Tax=Battus philenor TaxID=42288 RepID=UPI0035D05B84
MARRVVYLLILTVASCMEMRETVERMVMVRTTGSDLQPAATGYIYKKQSDGLASVTKMDESEILEQLSKFYDQPKVYAAPDKDASGKSAEADESKAASNSKEAYVIPVEEKQEEKDDHIDGIADDDYAKHYDGYDDYKKKFADYLHGLGHFKDGIYHEHGGGESYGSDGHHEYGGKGYKGFGAKHHYAKGEDDDYNKKGYEGFYGSDEGGHKKEYDEADKYGEHYEKGHGEKGGDHGHKEEHSKGEKVEGFHKVYDKDEFKKDHDFYEGDAHKGDFHKYDKGHKYHESDKGEHKKGDSHDSAHHEAGYGKEGHNEKKSGDGHGAGFSVEKGGKSGYHGHEDFGAKGGAFKGKEYGYEIKH